MHTHTHTSLLMNQEEILTANPLISIQHQEYQRDQFKQDSEWKRTVLPESSFPASPPGAPTLAYQVDSMHFEEGRVLFYMQE